MSRLSKFQIMNLFKDEIQEEIVTKIPPTVRIHHLEDILKENRKSWKLPSTTSLDDLKYFLQTEKIIDSFTLKFPKHEMTFIFPIEEKPTIFEVACNIHARCYISHYSAAFLHGLTDNIVKTVYVNQEQSKKPKSQELSLSQQQIDQAFQRPIRTSNRVATYDGDQILWLNGKATDDLGVIEKDGLRYTSIERTLIDIAVRPDYSGGISEVLTIYKNAQGDVSINKLQAMLKKLDYTYPYHQSIGFYLERAGYKESALQLLDRLPKTVDFYLGHQLKKPSYSERWKLYYPSHLDDSN